MKAKGKRRVTKLGGYMLVLGLAVAVFWPVDHWRLYDDLWRPLALTQAENYCSGQAVANSGFDADSPIEEDCYEKTGMDNKTPSISNSIPWACQGINSVTGSSYTVDQCIAEVEAFDIWFLLKGGYTWQWSEARPRPEEITIEPENPRATSRGDFGIDEQDTTTTTVEEGE